MMAQEQHGRHETAEPELDPARLRWLIRSIREDRAVTREGAMSPGLHAAAVHRFGVWALNKPLLLRRALSVVYWTLFMFVRGVYGIELPRATKIGRRLWVAHQSGIVVSPYAVLGDDCVIRQNVTIGMATGGRRRGPPFAPRLGNGVEVGAGAVVVGGIVVGHGARIGPNAVVTTDVPDGGSAFAPPAKMMSSLRAPARSEAT